MGQGRQSRLAGLESSTDCPVFRCRRASALGVKRLPGIATLAMDGLELFRGLDAVRVLRNQRRLEMQALDSAAMTVLVSGSKPPRPAAPPSRRKRAPKC